MTKDDCDLKLCDKRHPTFCNYYRRKKHTFNDECLLKHEEVGNQKKNVGNCLTKENNEWKNEMK